MAEAQRQFAEAQTDIENKVKQWGWLSIGSLILFLALVIILMFITLPETSGWPAVYYTALRIALLSGLAALAGFSFKVLRAYMDMRERNLHRQRVANSIEAFVVSAQTPEVRDFILAHLVESVASYGSSGLVQKDGDFDIHKLPSDTVLKILANIGKKE